MTRPVFKKSTKFGAISIKPSASVKTFQQNGSFSTKSVFGEDDELLAKKPAATMPDARPVTKNDIDPLEAFMDTIKKVQVSDNGHLNSESVNQVLPLGFESDEDDPSNELLFSSPDDLIAAAAAKIAAKRKEIAVVDHSSIVYDAFRKDFYVEPPEVSQMTPEEVEEKRIEMDGIKIRGARCPKPIEKWTQFGLPPAVLEVIRKVLKYEKPSPIQSQGIPAIMNGRDVIGIAKTGSGKVRIYFSISML